MNFIKEFRPKIECAINQIFVRNLALSNMPRSGMDRTYKKYRPSFREAVHPYIIMMEGYVKSLSVEIDLVNKYHYPKINIMAFSEGFLNEPNYSDRYYRDDKALNEALYAFNLGRFLLNKHFATALRCDESLL